MTIGILYKNLQSLSILLPNYFYDNSEVLQHAASNFQNSK